MFHPLSPLSGWTVSSCEFFTTTTSPMIELRKNQAAGVDLSPPPRWSKRPTQPWLTFAEPKVGLPA